MERLRFLRLPFGALVLFTVGLLSVVGYWTAMPGSASKVLSRPLTPDEGTTRSALRRDVEFLASGPRNRVDAPDHERATVEYIEQRLKGLGYAPKRQAVESDAGVFQNVLVRIDGNSSPDELVVIGAHWDTRGPTPGADDNATGVAAGLDLAKWLADNKPGRSVELAFWANEEPPFFRTEAMGSLVHARSLKAAEANVVWMLSLEMLGYYDDSPNSQQYPPVVNLFYPNHGAFIAFVGSMYHRDAVTNPVRVLREQSDFPTYGFAGPPEMKGIGFSDHWSFWQVGYPGVMVNDTSFYRTPHYHQYSDTPDTLDWDRFARVTVALRAAVADAAIVR